jgi:hypothetical protein
LTPDEFREVQNAFDDGFVDSLDLTMFLRLYLGRKLANIAPAAATLSGQIFLVLSSAEAQGWLEPLITAFLEVRPANGKVRVVANRLRLVDDLQLVPPSKQPGQPIRTPVSPALEKLTRPGPVGADVEVFAAGYGRARKRVCLISLNGAAAGTGFLVGPDLVLTNQHVVESVLNGAVSPDAVRCVVDFVKLPGGGPDLRREYRLAAPEWCVDSTPPADGERDGTEPAPTATQLDYALLRLATAAGNDSIGDHADTNAGARGWTPLSSEASAGASGEDVIVLQHAAGEAMKISFGRHLGFKFDGRRVRYDANTLAGSSGSPVYTAGFELVALHHYGDPSWTAPGQLAAFNQGVPIGRIAALLKARNKLPA